MSFETSENFTPHSEDAEQAVLASVMFGGALALASALITPEDMYNPLNGHVFKVMLHLDANKRGIDEITISTAISDAGEFDPREALLYVVEIAGSSANKANIESYARTVKDFSNERQVIRVAGEMINEIKRGDGTSQERVNNAMSLFNAIDTEVHEQKEFKVQLRDFHESMSRKAETTSEITGIATGFGELDRATCGLQDSDLIYVGARPGQGKTTFCMNIVSHVAKKLKKDEGVVMVFSMEMPADQIIGRMHAAEGSVKMNSIKAPGVYMGKGGCSGYDGFSAAAVKITQMIGSIIIDDRPGLSPMEVRAACLAAERKYGRVKMVMLDYVQIMRYPGIANPVDRIGACSNALKALAQEMRCPVVVPAQLNREVEKRSDKRPALSDLKGSGALEQDADAIWFIHSDDDCDEQERSDGSDESFVSLVIAKFRAGETQDILFKKDLSTNRFINHEMIYS